MNFTMSVAQDGKNIRAKIRDDKGIYDYNGTVNGNDVNFGHDSERMPGLRIEYMGTVAANVITGKAVFGSYGEGTFAAKRQ